MYRIQPTTPTDYEDVLRISFYSSRSTLADKIHLGKPIQTKEQDPHGEVGNAAATEQLGCTFSTLLTCVDVF